MENNYLKKLQAILIWFDLIFYDNVILTKTTIKHFWPKEILFHNPRKEVPVELHPLSYVNEVNGGAPVTAGRWTPIRELADGRQLCLRLCRQEVFEEPCQLLQWCKEKDPFRFYPCLCFLPLQTRGNMRAVTSHCRGLSFASDASDLRVDLLQLFPAARLSSWEPLQSDGFMDSRIS